MFCGLNRNTPSHFVMWKLGNKLPHLVIGILHLTLYCRDTATFGNI